MNPKAQLRDGQYSVGQFSLLSQKTKTVKPTKRQPNPKRSKQEKQRPRNRQTRSKLTDKKTGRLASQAEHARQSGTSERGPV